MLTRTAPRSRASRTEGNQDLSETQRPENQSYSQQSQANIMRKTTTRATAKNTPAPASTSPSTADLSPRERIIAAARHLFGQKGFHNTTTAELATEAAVSTDQIYRHFDAKADIVLPFSKEPCVRASRR